MKKIQISKKNGIWFCELIERFKKKPKEYHEKERYFNKATDKVEANSFGELMIKVGDKNWIDLINKNPEDETTKD